MSYESTVEIDGVDVAVRVASDAPEDRERLDELVEVVKRDKDQYLDRVTDELLEDKNEEWLSDGESPLSKQDFRSRLALEAIEVGPGGAMELVLDDDGMFWGHELVVNLDPAYGIARVNLEG